MPAAVCTAACLCGASAAQQEIELQFGLSLYRPSLTVDELFLPRGEEEKKGGGL